MEADAWAYHLQSPPNWFQSKNLILFPSNDFRTVLFPDNSNFLVLWTFLSFGSDHLIELYPYSFIVVGVLVIFNLLSKLKITSGKKSYDLIFSIALLYYFSGPYISHFSKTTGGDISLATLTIISLSMLYSYLVSGSAKIKFIYLLFFSMSTSLLLGTKMTGFLNIMVLFACAIFFELMILKKYIKPAFILPYLPALIFSFVTGGFYFFRSLFIFHNPFYPKEMSIPLIINLPGYQMERYDIQGINIVRTLATIKILFRLLIQKMQFGYQLPLLYIPSFMMLSLVYFKKIDKYIWLIILCPAITTLFFLLLVNGIDARYFFYLSLTGIISLYCLTRVISSESFNRSLIFLITVLVIFTSLNLKSWEMFKQLSFISKGNFLDKPITDFYYDLDFEFFLKNVPKNSNILLILPENPLISPFYGNYYENRLYYANTSDYQEIIRKIKQNQIDILLTKSDKSDLSSIYYKWDFDTGNFNLIDENHIKDTISQLLETNAIKLMGTGTRLTFYSTTTNK